VRARVLLDGVSLDEVLSAADSLSTIHSIALPNISVVASIAGHARTAVSHSGAISMPDIFIESLLYGEGIRAFRMMSIDADHAPLHRVFSRT
jgi:hypothetical protein